MARSGSAPSAPAAALDRRYRTAFIDWLSCAVAGAGERAARCARATAESLSERVLATAVAGHVLDFDDTYVPGLAHLSAPTAPVALVLGAELGCTIGDALAAYADGFEAMGALARRSHPALYEHGWHPTAVCGAVGAAVVAARLLGHARDEVAGRAVRLALAQASGLRRSFGSDAKAIQVGGAARAGVTAALLARDGASATPDIATGPGGFEEAFGGSWAEPLALPDATSAIAENWIKAYPCCLQTHSAIEATAPVREDPAFGPLRTRGSIIVQVHPRARQAAPYDDVESGLQAKFSIPYTVAYTLLHGPPRDPACFRSVDPAARRLAVEGVEVRLDPLLPETAAVLRAGEDELGRVESATGSPARPLSDEQLAEKLRRLAGGRLDGVLDAAGVEARELLQISGLS